MFKDIWDSSLCIDVQEGIEAVALVCIRSKTKFVNMLKKYTRKQDLVKFGKTQFATAFLTLKQLHEQKNNFWRLFNLTEFLGSSYFKKEARKECSRVVQMLKFWNTILETLKIGDPLISTLRLVDGDVKSSMGYIYPMMEITKEATTSAFNNIITWASTKWCLKSLIRGKALALATIACNCLLLESRLFSVYMQDTDFS